MSPEDLHAAIAAGTAPAILDVRTPREFGEGHVPGAVNIPFTEIAARAGELAASKHHPVVVYCGHGPRAWIAARTLRRAGFTRVEYLRGHMAAWRQAGLVTTAPSQR
jgi:phage shock protein E